MRLPRRRHADAGIYEPNMTPLIDVSLVLVVILMVATPMAYQSGIAVNAASKSGKAAEQVKTERIELSVLADGRVTVNRTTVARDSLGRLLKPLLLAAPNGMLVLRCADGVPHGDFVSVLDEARQLGAAKIAVVGS